uniref:Uncharacterized protein n=1 Tax=Sus scrofa TaxID=9823 RepID=A0A4X1U9H8_PIG
LCCINSRWNLWESMKTKGLMYMDRYRNNDIYVCIPGLEYTCIFPSCVCLGGLRSNDIPLSASTATPSSWFLIPFSNKR